MSAIQIETNKNNFIDLTGNTPVATDDQSQVSSAAARALSQNGVRRRPRTKVRYEAYPRPVVPMATIDPLSPSGKPLVTVASIFSSSLMNQPQVSTTAAQARPKKKRGGPPTIVGRTASTQLATVKRVPPEKQEETRSSIFMQLATDIKNTPVDQREACFQNAIKAFSRKVGIDYTLKGLKKDVQSFLDREAAQLQEQEIRKAAELLLTLS